MHLPAWHRLGCRLGAADLRPQCDRQSPPRQCVADPLQQGGYRDQPSMVRAPRPTNHTAVLVSRNAGSCRAEPASVSLQGGAPGALRDGGWAALCEAVALPCWPAGRMLCRQQGLGRTPAGPPCCNSLVTRYRTSIPPPLPMRFVQTHPESLAGGMFPDYA